MMRRYNAESSAIGATVLVGAFSIYAAGERLGVIGAISPWGLVGIACILQYAVAMYVYYRLGMNPEAQEKPAARPSSRSGAKPITVHLAKEVRDQLKILSVQNDTTMQNLICEAFNDLFAKYGKPEIARI